MLINFESQLTQLWDNTYDFRAYRTSSSEILLQILALLLLKSLSDKKIGEYELPEELHFSRLVDQAVLDMDGLGEHLNSAFKQFEEITAPLLNGLCTHIDFRAIYGNDDGFASSLLSAVVTFMQGIEAIDKTALIGHYIPTLIAYFSEKQQTLTVPIAVTQLVNNIIEVNDNDEVCDPFCVDGSLIAACVNSKSSSKVCIQSLTQINSLVSRISLTLQGAHNVEPAVGNALSEPLFLANKSSLKLFDALVSFPPIRDKNWPYDMAKADKFNRFHYGVPPRYKAELAYVLHIVESMKPEVGRAAVIVPQGLLYRGSTEYDIRKALIDDNLLDAIIRLPSGLFNGTGLPLVLLLFKSSKRDQKILFIDASQVKHKSLCTSKLGIDEVVHLTEVYKKRENVKELAYVADYKEIVAHDYNLNISRYVTPERSKPDVDELMKQYEDLNKELIQAQNKITLYMSEQQR